MRPTLKLGGTLNPFAPLTLRTLWRYKNVPYLLTYTRCRGPNLAFRALGCADTELSCYTDDMIEFYTDLLPQWQWTWQTYLIDPSQYLTTSALSAVISFTVAGRKMSESFLAASTRSPTSIFRCSVKGPNMWTDCWVDTDPSLHRILYSRGTSVWLTTSPGWISQTSDNYKQTAVWK